jgi:hypothetical protein
VLDRLSEEPLVPLAILVLQKVSKPINIFESCGPHVLGHRSLIFLTVVVHFGSTDVKTVLEMIHAIEVTDGTRPTY